MLAYHTEGEAIGDADTLLRLALEVGLPEDDVREVLATDRYATDVREDERTAMTPRDQRRALLRRRSADGRRRRAPGRGPRRAAAARLGSAGARMKQIGFITQGHSDYDERLRAVLDASGIDPEEFLGLEYFSLTPFFVLAGATVSPDAHTHAAPTSTSAPCASPSPRSSRRRSSQRCPRCSRTPTPKRNDGRATRASVRTAASRLARASSARPAGATSPRSIGCRRGRSGRSRRAHDDRPLADRCEEATAAFLAAMHAAGDPGTKKTKMAGGSGFLAGPRRSRAGSSARSSATTTFRPSATSQAWSSASRVPSTSSTTRPAATARGTSPSGSTPSRRSRWRCRSRRA